MGSFGTVVFIHNEKQKTKEEFTEEFCKSMEKRGYKRATEKSGSSYVLVFSENSDWVTLKRTAYEDDRAAVMEDSGWFAENMQTHCISIEIVDSDFANLSLYCQSKEVTDLAVVGDPTGYMGGNPSSVKRGTKVYWKPLLKEGSTWEQFQEVLAADHTFAEDGLDEMAPLLGMDMGSMDADGLSSNGDEPNTMVLYFSSAESSLKKIQPVLRRNAGSLSADESQPDKNGKRTVILNFRKKFRKPSLSAVFKQVFGEGLKEHGFDKIKGKQPYFVRVIGDEIIHIVTCMSNWCGDRGYKEFSIWGAAGTIYRGAIDFHSSPENSTWGLQDLSTFYTKTHETDFDNEYRVKLASFMYKEDDENSLYNQMKYALEETEKIMLPILDQIEDTESSLEYFFAIGTISFSSPVYEENRGDFAPGEFDDSLLLVQMNNHDDFRNMCQKELEKDYEAIKRGISNWSREKAQQEKEEYRLRIVALRDRIYNNPELYEKALAELKRRKQANQEVLRYYNLIS